MSEKEIKKMIAATFLDVAEALKTGEFESGKVTIGIAAVDSEHGPEEFEEAARLTAKKGINAILIDGEDAHAKMEQMLEAGEIDGAVTMHYPFPIGVSTVGKIVTPAKGKAMYIATTTGTSDTDRVRAMIRNAVYGIIAAKADGIGDPSVGIANIDGARQCEKALLRLAENGYPIRFAGSARADGGCIMRGNDLLKASADVMVMDSLCGNLMIKIFSAYATGGGYESSGWGYGPGIGEDFDKVIMIISRASGAPQIANACEYAANIIKGGVFNVTMREIDAVKKAGLDTILKEISEPKKTDADEKAVTKPPTEVVTAQIAGIEVMDLEDAVQKLWKENIYAESGMGCTGPVVLISEANADCAKEILQDSGYIK